MAKFYATTLPGAMVLRDVLIDGADSYTSQIDLLIVGNKGVYVIEVKTFPDAKIYGDTQKSKWYYYNHGKRYEIYSPLKQNAQHVRYLKTFLKDFGEVPCFSVITMVCEDFKVSGNFPPDTVLCNSMPAMERAIYKLAKNKEPIWNDTQKKAVCEYVASHQHHGKAARTAHKQNVIAYQESLEKQKEQRICPYCKTELVLRNGKNGTFYGCKNFPKCRYTASK